MNSQLSNLNIIQFLGEGASGKVYLVKNISNNQLFSLKEIEIDQNDQNQVKNINREINIMNNMSNINHPNIMKYYYYFIEKNKLYYVLEFLDGENLDDLAQRYIKMKQYFNQNLIIIILKGIINGLLYLHQRNIIHRDIAPDNIMIDKNNNIKITDFGISKLNQFYNNNNINNNQFININTNTINKPNLTTIGREEYISPEIYQSYKNKQFLAKYDFKTDIYSLGVTMFYLMNFLLPFIYEENTMKKVRTNIFIDPNKYNQQLIKMVMNMLEENPKKRPSCQDLFNDLGNLIGFNNMDIYHTIKMDDINLENNYIIKRSAFFSVIYCLYNIPAFKLYFENNTKILTKDTNDSNFVIKNFIEVINDYKKKEKRINSITQFIENISQKIVIFKEYNKLSPKFIIEILLEYFCNSINQLFVYNNTTAMNLNIIFTNNQNANPVILQKIEEFNKYTNIFADFFYFLILKQIKCPKCDNIIEENIDFEYEIEFNEPTYIDQLFHQFDKIPNFGKNSKICKKCFEMPMNLIETKTLINAPKILIIHSEINLQIQESIKIGEYISPNKRNYSLLSIIVKELMNNNDFRYCVSIKKNYSNIWIYYPNEEEIPIALSFDQLLQKGDICTVFYQLNEK